MTALELNCPTPNECCYPNCKCLESNSEQEKLDRKATDEKKQKPEYNKPNFWELAKLVYPDKDDEEQRENRGVYVFGCRDIWEGYVKPLQRELEQAKEANAKEEERLTKELRQTEKWLEESQERNRAGFNEANLHYAEYAKEIESLKAQLSEGKQGYVLSGDEQQQPDQVISETKEPSEWEKVKEQSSDEAYEEMLKVEAEVERERKEELRGEFYQRFTAESGDGFCMTSDGDIPYKAFEFMWSKLSVGKDK